MSVSSLRDEILAAARDCKWLRDTIHGDDGETAAALIGTSSSARITVAAFEIEDAGAKTGYDGAIAFFREGRMVHLPRDLAEEVYRLADRLADTRVT